jgi:DNA-binding CsgD family transcriptional regulator/sugar lactone lactonase YvrE
LSPREREVAALVAEGLTNREIAKKLFISERTVDGHLEHLREKLDVNTRAQIATWYVRQATSAAVVAAPIEPAIQAAQARRLMAKPRIWVATALVLALLAAGVGLLRLTAPPPPTIKSIAGATLDLNQYPGGGYTGDGGPATAAQLSRPSDVVVAADGTIYIADYGNNVVREVSGGIITSFTGTGNKKPASPGDIAAAVSLGDPSNLAVDAGGNLYVLTDMAGSLEVWMVRADVHSISRLAVLGLIVTTNYWKASGGGLAVAKDGTLYVADRAHNRVMKFANGQLSDFAGTGAEGFSGDGGAAKDATFDSPIGLALDDHGNLYIADALNNRIRKVDTFGTITTVAGSGAVGDGGDGGPALLASFSIPYGVAVAHDGTLVISDAGNNRLREVTPGQEILAVTASSQDGFAGDGFPAIAALLSAPEGVAFDSHGNLYLADTGNQRVREIVGLVPSK